MLTIDNLGKSYGEKLLFENINNTISGNARIGLIGVNGTGKSTYLKVLAGIETADTGGVSHPKDYTIEYLSQNPALDGDLTVMEQIYYGGSTVMKVMREYEQALINLECDPVSEKAQNQLIHMQGEMDKENAWEANTTAKTILTKLGITSFDKRVSELSGGQKKRVAIAKALIQPADLLILDEPTNHLDNESIVWLEKYLQTYRGALLLVTHDRYFLNRVTNFIYELSNGNLYVYEGNYEYFLEKKVEREELEVNLVQRHRNTLRQELAWLQRGARARSTKQRARIERVDELQAKKFHAPEGKVDFQVGSTRLGKQVIELVSVGKGFNDKVLFTDFSFLIKPGDRIGIIGPNGAGKTTLLNIIANRQAADSGEIKIGETVKIGYYTQGEEELDGNKRIIEYIKEIAEVVHTKDGDMITAEQMLEHFLFSRAQQWTYINRLSGGEKRRLYLLKILMTEPNVIVLDEPTNDLDTQTLSILEEYLHHFPGVVVTVSHDRYFLDSVVDQLFVFDGSGGVDLFYGNYSEYNELLEGVEEKSEQVKKLETVQKKKTKLSYNEQKEWEVIEEEIMELEKGIEILAEQIASAGSNFAKVQESFDKQKQTEQELEVKMERWEQLSLLIESFSE